MRTLASVTLILLSLTALAQEQKENKKLANYEVILALIDGGEYEFVARRANPAGGRQLDLTTNPNFLRISKGDGKADMPYFGRAFSAGYSSSDGGIEFDGPLQALEIEKNDKKMRVSVKFKVKGEDDTFTCNLTITSMDNASLNVFSNKKQSIGYTGYVQKLKAKD
jgi:hypothetical protein